MTNLARDGLLVETPAANVTLLSPLVRYSLRFGEGDKNAFGEAIGVVLPDRVGERTLAHGGEIACLGPDEWIVVLPAEQANGFKAACAAAYATSPHGLADISKREVGFHIEGERARELITNGCPRALELIGVGETYRTMFDNITILLWRDGPQTFRMDVQRSFAPQLVEALKNGCQNLLAV